MELCDEKDLHIRRFVGGLSRVEITGGFSCDDSTLRFLLQKHKEVEEQSLNLGCSNSPVANTSWLIARLKVPRIESGSVIA